MRKNRWIAAAILPVSLLISCATPVHAADDDDDRSSVLPTGKRITPSAAPGAHFEALNPSLPGFPGFVAGQAISTAVSPDSRTLLILTSGYNLNAGPDGNNVPDASQEYVFVYDISGNTPAHRQVLKVRNTFVGICFSPDGKDFYVTGGKDDNVHTFSLLSNGQWEESGAPIPLGHTSGLGLNVGKEPLSTGGIAVTADGRTLVVANVYNDSISLIDLAAWTFKAAPSAILANTKLPIPASAFTPAGAPTSWKPSHDSAYWAEKTAGFDFSSEDRVNAEKFNRIIWEGIMGTAYPTDRSHADLRSGRDRILTVLPTTVR